MRLELLPEGISNETASIPANYKDIYSMVDISHHRHPNILLSAQSPNGTDPRSLPEYTDSLIELVWPRRTEMQHCLIISSLSQIDLAMEPTEHSTTAIH